MSDPTDNSGASIPQPLIDRERVRGATRVIAEGTLAAQVTPDQIAAVASDAEIFRRKFKLHRKDIATAVGYSNSVITEFLNGSYTGNAAQIAVDIEAWLVEEEHRRQQLHSTEFCWTNVALTIKSVASYALDYRRMACVYGPESSGIGKTTACQAIHQTLGPRKSAIATFDKVDGNLTGMLNKLCAAIRISAENSNRVKFGRIVDSLKGRSFLLMLDQMQNLRWSKDDQCLYALADLFDATNSAQLWVCTADMVSYLNRQRAKSADESLAQIRRRLFPCIDLLESLRGGDGGGQLLVTVDQVRAMFSKNKLRLASDSARFLAALINTPDEGGIGMAVQIVEFATMVAELADANEIGLAHIREAMSRCIGSARVEIVLRKMEEGPAPLARLAMVG